MNGEALKKCVPLSLNHAEDHLEGKTGSTLMGCLPTGPPHSASFPRPPLPPRQHTAPDMAPTAPATFSGLVQGVQQAPPPLSCSLLQAALRSCSGPLPCHLSLAVLPHPHPCALGHAPSL